MAKRRSYLFPSSFTLETVGGAATCNRHDARILTERRRLAIRRRRLGRAQKETTVRERTAERVRAYTAAIAVEPPRRCRLYPRGCVRGGRLPRIVNACADATPLLL